MGIVVTRHAESIVSVAPREGAESIAWAELVPIVHRQMRSLVGPCRDLEDLTQAALEQVLRSLNRFEGRAELSTFTYRICAHVAMNHWRWWKRWLRRFDLGHEHAGEPTAPTEATPDVLWERERGRRLHAALDKLPAAKRLILTLCDLEDLPASRVAAIVDCPEPTLRSRLRQARIDLAALLAADPCFQQGGDP